MSPGDCTPPMSECRRSPDASPTYGTSRWDVRIEHLDEPDVRVVRLAPRASHSRRDAAEVVEGLLRLDQLLGDRLDLRDPQGASSGASEIGPDVRRRLRAPRSAGARPSPGRSSWRDRILASRLHVGLPGLLDRHGRGPPRRCPAGVGALEQVEVVGGDVEQVAAEAPPEHQHPCVDGVGDGRGPGAGRIGHEGPTATRTLISQTRSSNVASL